MHTCPIVHQQVQSRWHPYTRSILFATQRNIMQRRIRTCQKALGDLLQSNIEQICASLSTAFRARSLSLNLGEMRIASSCCWDKNNRKMQNLICMYSYSPVIVPSYNLHTDILWYTNMKSWSLSDLSLKPMVNECEPWVRAIFGFCCLRTSRFCQAFAQRRVKLIFRR